MPAFMYQFKYAPAAWAAIVDQLLKGIGGRLISNQCSFGEWDGLVIFEVPGEITAMTALVSIIAPRHLEATNPTQGRTPTRASGAPWRSSRPSWPRTTGWPSGTAGTSRPRASSS